MKDQNLTKMRPKALIEIVEAWRRFWQAESATFNVFGCSKEEEQIAKETREHLRSLGERP